LISKITYKNEGRFHKGFLGKCGGVYRLIAKSHANKRKEDWSIALPNLPFPWVDMCVESILLPGHVSHTFLCSPISPTASAFDLVTSFVSAINLHCNYPPTVPQALADSHPVCDVWLASCKEEEEKEGLESLNTFCRITLGDYHALREKGAPCAIPAMCVLTIKKDENLLLLWAKSRIIALGNHKNRIWLKSDKFAPVLRGDSLCFLVSLAVQHCRPLRKGDCKNAFCQGILPPKEITIGIHLWVTPMWIPRNTGFFYVFFMAYSRVPTIGMTRSTPSSSLSACILLLRILAFTLVLLKIPQTRQACHHSILFVWDSMLTTLFIFQRILR
jgi:hypothetical protein